MFPLDVMEQSHKTCVWVFHSGQTSTCFHEKVEKAMQNMQYSICSCQTVWILKLLSSSSGYFVRDTTEKQLVCLFTAWPNKLRLF